MSYQAYIPKAPLSAFVDALWYCESEPPAHTRERVLPNGAMGLIVNLGQETLRVYEGENAERPIVYRGPLLAGPYSKAAVIDPSQLSVVMGAAFKPGGSLPFFPLPAADLHNADAPVDALWGSAAAGMRDRLLEAPTPAAKLRALESELSARLSEAPAHHDVVAFAVRHFQCVPHMRSIADVVSWTSFSPARFIEIFRRNVGMTPKVFCRIQRFQHALRTVSEGRRVDWADTALACGYYDQPHFIHDFRAFSGMSPTSYLADRGEYRNHVPMRDA